MKLFARLLFLLLLLLPVSVLADIPAGMQNDFSSLSGYIIMPIGDEFLVDLDATATLQEGDILTLVIPGEKVVHPVTKEVLGTLDIPKGFLQVTRIKSGYSYAKILYSESTPEKGDQIKRFEQVPTAFSATPTNAKLHADLKTGLPQLNWLEPGSPTQPLLTFSLQNNLLTVKNSAGTTLKSYQYVDDALVASNVIINRNASFKVDEDPAKNKGLLNKTVNKLIDSVGLGTSKDPLSPVGIIRNKEMLLSQGIWMSNDLQGSPVGLTVADFDNDGQQETAVALQNHLLISSIDQGVMSEEAKIEFPAGTDLLSIDSIDLDLNGQPEIYLTASRDYNLVSMVVEFTAGGYQIVISNVPWFLHVTEYPSGEKVLLGQKLGDNLQPFLDAPFLVSRSGDSLQKGTEISLPEHVNIYSFISFPTDAEGQLVAYLSQSDYLKVASPAGVNMWESGDYFGGTETLFYTQADNDSQLGNPVYMQQRILRDTSGNLLVAQNDGLRAMQRFRMFKNCRVIALSWNGFAMQEIWRTSGQNGYLADFALADADNDGIEELVMVVKFKHKTIIQKARSSILIYELN